MTAATATESTNDVSTASPIPIERFDAPSQTSGQLRQEGFAFTVVTESEQIVMIQVMIQHVNLFPVIEAGGPRNDVMVRLPK